MCRHATVKVGVYKGLGKSRQGLDKEWEEVREKEKGRSKGCRRIEARKEGGGGRRI